MIKAFFILFLAIVLCETIFIHKQIGSNQHFCMYDDIPRHTLIKIDVKTEGNFKFQFKQGMIPIVTMNLNKSGLTKSLTTQRYGIHHFCFLNQGQHKSTIALQISIGSQANDYGSVRGGDELVQALVNQGKIAQQFIQQIVRENTQGMEIMIHEAQENHNFGQYLLFTIVFGAVSVVLTYLQFRVIKKHLHSRKYI